MNVIVLHPAASKESAEMLAGFLGCQASNPFKTGERKYTEYDLVINYGCNRKLTTNAKINSATAVARCIDKFSTFSLLSKYNIPVPQYTLDKNVAALWPCVVVRAEKDGAMNAGMEYCYPKGKAARIPDAELYTEYYDHKKEFRVVVLKNAIIACYEKVREGEEWMFYERSYQYLQPVQQACLDAAAVLKIDYVGFDVLVNKENEFVILEANSAPIITEDVMKAFRRIIKKMEKGIGNGA